MASLSKSKKATLNHVVLWVVCLLVALTPKVARARSVVVWFGTELPSEIALSRAVDVVGPATMVVSVLAEGGPAEAVARGVTTGFSRTLRRELINHGLRENGPVFVAVVVDDGVVVLPYAFGATLSEKSMVRVLTLADLQFEALRTPSLNGESDSSLLTGAVIGAEILVGPFVAHLDGGTVVTPGRTRTYPGDGDSLETSDIAIQWRAGMGLYAKRPNSKQQSTLSLQATMGFIGPQDRTFGGLVVYGMPMGSEGSWLRIGVSVQQTDISILTAGPMDDGLLRAGVVIGLQNLL